MTAKTNFPIVLKSAVTLLAFASLGSVSRGAAVEPHLSLSNTDSPSIIVSPGSLFSLTVVATEIGSSQSLDSYDLQFSSDPTTLAPIASGLTLESFTDTVTNNFSASNLPTAEYSNIFNDPSDDVTINSTPLPLVTANFKAIDPGTYHIYFAPAAANNPDGSQDLYAYDSDTGEDNDFPFTQELNFSVTVTPEPSAAALAALGALLMVGWKLRRRPQAS